MSEHEKHALIEIELFIARMEKETGVSKRFLDVARPSIERAFLEVPRARRHDCLAAIETSCRTQAKTEKSIKSVISKPVPIWFIFKPARLTKILNKYNPSTEWQAGRWDCAR